MSKIAYLPQFEKPREKAIHFGIHSLSNCELLALILRNGTKNHSALEVAEELLKNEKINEAKFRTFFEEE